MRNIVTCVCKKSVVLVALLMVMTLGLSSCRTKGNLVYQKAGEIPIQHKGRIKPLEAFARESLHLISTKEHWRGKSAVVFLLDVLSKKENIMEMECVRLDYPQLKEILSLDKEKKYFSFEQLKPSFPFIMSTLENVQKKRKEDKAITQLERKVEMLYSRLDMVGQLNSGNDVMVIPHLEGDDCWHSLYESKSPLAQDFMNMMTTYREGSSDEFIAQVNEWNEKIRVSSVGSFQEKLKLEIMYYKLKPFVYSWICYLLAFILLVCFQKIVFFRGVSYLLLLIGFLYHTGGLLLRGIILSRPPVSNMYESMIFMNWIVMICAGIFFIMKRKDLFLTSGAIVSALVMIYAALLPIESSLEVLAPVLRSNYWLTVHVMTIMASYGIFGLAMALGHRHLLFVVFKKFSSDDEKDSAHILTRLLQAGLITLGAGTILGGVWANESWGRFWGWDPKETWALITFLGYMAIIHLRYAKKISCFGLAVASIVGFLLVLMTWYGVNFLLGKGLHSYGSGVGGVEWIIYYLIFEICFLGFVFVKRKSNS